MALLASCGLHFCLSDMEEGVRLAVSIRVASPWYMHISGRALNPWLHKVAF